ncbi:MAG: hypothetical protein HRU17_05275 [Polyangiaceae bacterium]|nr:hypothetical protein [Polyangiaceae bacterium]
MLPSLPQQDPSPGARRADLARAKQTYPLKHAYKSEARPDGFALAAQVPPRDEFAPAMSLKIAAVDTRLLANHALIDVEAISNGVSGKSGSTFGDFLGLTRAVGTRHKMFSRPFQAATRIGRSFPPSIESYKEVFLAVPKPPTMEVVDDPAKRNRLFGWYRVAGNNPYVIQGIRRVAEKPEDHEGILQEVAQAAVGELEKLGHSIEDKLPAWAKAILSPAAGTGGAPAGEPMKQPPDAPGVLPKRFPVTNEIYQKAMGTDDSLQQAAAENRLYLADYRLCDNLPQGTWQDGALGIERNKYLYAPMALFAWRPETDDETGQLVPVCIQCHQTATAKRPNPIFTPLDGTRWDMAVSVVQSSDANHHEMVWHLGRSHMVMEAVYVCARRTMASHHPLMILLAQHCEFTLAINDYATKHLIAPGGQVDTLFGSTLPGILTIMSRAVSEYQLDRASPPDQAEDRLIDDLNGLPEFPFRDDAGALWTPFARWIGEYVGLYYCRSEDVTNDTELTDFLKMLGAAAGGNLSGIPEVNDVAALQKFIATLCWIGSGQHSALNYTQFPFMSYPPAMPLALYAEAPKEDTPENSLNWVAMLAPASDAMMAVDISYQLSGVKWRTIGHYADCAFADVRVKPFLKRLYRNFETVEEQSRDRDKHRFLSYSFLFPSNAQNSIFI